MSDSKLDYASVRTTTGAIRTPAGPAGRTIYEPATKLDLPGTLNEFLGLADQPASQIVGAKAFQTREVANGVSDGTPASFGAPSTGWRWHIQRMFIDFIDTAFAGDIILNVGSYRLDGGETSTSSLMFAVADESMPVLADSGDIVTVQADDPINVPTLPFIVYMQFVQEPK